MHAGRDNVMAQDINELAPKNAAKESYLPSYVPTRAPAPKGISVQIGGSFWNFSKDFDIDGGRTWHPQAVLSSSVNVTSHAGSISAIDSWDMSPGWL